MSGNFAYLIAFISNLNFNNSHAFIDNLTEILISKTDVSNLIIVGDWNVTRGCDNKGGIRWKPGAYRDLLVQFMNELDLVDVLRIKNPIAKGVVLTNLACLK